MVKIVGILNVTPDSFSDGGNFYKTDDAVRHAGKLVEEGADVIDIGGESSRPGSRPVETDEELKRVIPVIREVKKRFKIPVSIDTYKSRVASAAIDEGAEIVNDITGLTYGCEEMADMISQKKVRVVIMHIKGMPENMQNDPVYGDVIAEINSFLKKQVEFAVSRGIDGKNIIIDPGIGFGKSVQHNLLIIKKLAEFKKLNLPVMVGPSRKSFIGTLLDKDVTHRLEGTIAACLAAAQSGADYLRVHDAGSVKNALKIFEAIIFAAPGSNGFLKG